jgi:hypothetical protein
MGVDVAEIVRKHRYSGGHSRFPARLLLGLAVALIAALVGGAAGRERAAAQERPPFLKVDLVVPAWSGEHPIPTDLCAFLPEEATTVSVARRPLVPEAGGDRPLWMTIRPYVSTASPLVERAYVADRLVITLPQLGYETCFTFENTISEGEAQGAAQAYKYFAQIVGLEVR